MSPSAQPGIGQTPEGQLRGGTYSLLAALLRSPPKTDIIERLRAIQVAPGEPLDAISAAWAELQQAASKADLEALDDEYHTLFIGVGRGELVPYGSWYLTGFLMEKPLGDLRRDLAMLGYERQSSVHEPEDHAAALCEVMALLIMEEKAPLDVQRPFFETHLGSWLETFFLDLQKARSARFYQPVGRLGYAFVRLEKQYLTMLI